MSTLSTTNLKNPSSGSNNIVLNADGTTTVTAPSNLIKSGTAVASTSGVAIDFTGIPSWVKRVTVMFNVVSTNGSSIIQIQMGAGAAPETSSYNSNTSFVSTTNNTTRAATATSGFISNYASNATDTYTGAIVLSLLSSNAWLCNGNIAVTNTGVASMSGSKTLSGTLDRVRITTVNGTDTFDAGSINILYEG
jgi:hypothetical protein